MNKKNNLPGFTFVELIVVIGLIAILQGVLLVAINPGKQFDKAKNTKRKNHVNVLVQALSQYSNENGKYPDGITDIPQSIASNAVDLCSDLAPEFVASLPVDPAIGNSNIQPTQCSEYYDTGYMVYKDNQTLRIIVTAPLSDSGEEIEASQ